MLRRPPSSPLASLALVPLLLAGGGGPWREGRPAPALRRRSAAVADVPTAAGGPLPPAPPGNPASDEGMWTLDNFPSDRVAKRYGFSPSKEWLEHVRLSSVRLAGGCSGSIVSPNGLVMTNHHCAHSCIEQLSTAKKDFVKSGFYAKTEADEIKCPEIEVNQLVEIKDVTAQVNLATKGLAGKEYNAAQKAEISRIEKACATGDSVRCDVVSLYHGGLYHLYKYQRYQDVRLVFAPEFAIAFFGGDPDNFNFPRYDLDVSFLRLYEGGKPAKAAHYFKWSPAGAKSGDLTFVSGHPGSTSRMLTVAELEYTRDVALPTRLLRLSEVRGVLTEFQNRGAEQKRVSNTLLFGIENGLKALKGRHQALLNPEVFGAKVAAEQALRARVESDPELKKTYGGAWEAIAQAERELKKIRKPYTFIEQAAGFWSDRFQFARTLVRAAAELPKANDARLSEYTDSRLPGIKQSLFSTAPLNDEFEARVLELTLTQLREELGADDPFVKKVLGQDSPHDLAARLVKETKLGDLKVRKALFDGGAAAVAASKDPMIELARLVDPDARAVRKRYEDEVEGVIKNNSELIAKAQFQAYGTSVYPDATFTLRLAYGQVKGWDEAGTPVAPITTIAGAFARHTGKDPFALPKSWLDAKAKLALDTPFNFAATNDIIGGNSGSPVIDKDAQVVGLIFDSNIHGLGGDYFYDDKLNRSVAVHSAALTEALDKVYGAGRIVSELKGAPAK